MGDLLQSYTYELHKQEKVMDQDIKESLELRKEFPKAFNEVHLKWNEVCAIVRGFETGCFEGEEFTSAYRRMIKVKNDSYARIRREEGIE